MVGCLEVVEVAEELVRIRIRTRTRRRRKKFVKFKKEKMQGQLRSTGKVIFSARQKKASGHHPLFKWCVCLAFFGAPIFWRAEKLERKGRSSLKKRGLRIQLQLPCGLTCWLPGRLSRRL